MNSDEILGLILECKENMVFSANAIELFVLISHLQVSQRYVNGGSAAIARKLIEEFIETLCKAVPEARPLIEMGNDPSLDVTQEYFDQEF